jgi:glycerophosphoryl diester phosphodiesterase
MQGAVAYGARGFALDVQSSADGHAVIFRDATLECRTNGTGRVSDRPLEYLKQLDVGFGYTPDGGRTFPLRGRGIGAMPAAAEVIRAYPREQLIFKLSAPSAADALVRAFQEVGVPIGDNITFAGSAPALERVRALIRGGRVLDPAASEACLAEYRRVGWLSIVPDSCRDVTLLLPREGSWTLWGWPNRFLNRLHGVGARFLVHGDGPPDHLVGLDQPEQLGEVPRNYRGMLLIEDMWNVGRSLQR